jgi:pyruvate carboxylase
MIRKAEKLFVYGTLRRGFPLHRELAKLDARYIGRGRIGGDLFNLGEYPGVLPAASSRKGVEGELYELRKPEEQIPILDQLEEFDAKRPSKSLFVRRRATVRMNDGSRVRAWVYFLPRRPARASVISSGDYAEARRARS